MIDSIEHDVEELQDKLHALLNGHLALCTYLRIEPSPAVVPGNPTTDAATRLGGVRQQLQRTSSKISELHSVFDQIMQEVAGYTPDLPTSTGDAVPDRPERY